MSEIQGPFTHDLTDAFAARVAQVAEETAAPTGSGWWMSFTDPDIAATIPDGEQRPGGPSFLGACFVLADCVPSALTLSHVLGINPGGQVAFAGPVPPERAALVPERFVNVLMDRETCAEFDRVMEGL